MPKKTGSPASYVTIREIAEKAGVSVNSVSRALNDKNDIGEKTKAHIKKIAEELGYIRHIAASGLRSGGTKSIGVIVTHIDNAFFSRILQGINDCVAEKGYTILILSSNEDVEVEARDIRLLMAYRVSGILIAPAYDLKNKIDYSTIQAPYIEIVRHISRSASGYYISDSRKSGELAAERFISMGRRKCAYLGFEKPVSCNKDRMNGYAQRLRKESLSFGTRSIRTCEANTEAAFKTMTQWIDDGFDFDGLFVYNDAMAFGAIRALVDSGVKIPRDVSVIGHDDIETAQSFIPRLTTIQVPKYRLGFDSASSLLSSLEPNTEYSLSKHVIYEPELIIRET
jgi:LacI family transcriptional regulator